MIERRHYSPAGATLRRLAPLAAALWFAAIPAKAAPPAETPKEESAETTAKRAEKIAAEAYEAYKAGDYPKAVALYNSAIQLQPTATLYYNIARIYDTKLNEYELAIEYYRRFVTAPDADPELIGKATARIASLKELQEKQAKEKEAALSAPKKGETKPAPAPLPPVEPSPGFPYKTTGIIVGAVGVVGLTLGTIFGLNALSRDKDASTYCSRSTCTDPRGIELASDAHTLGNLSTVSFVAGGALTAIGAVIYLVGPSPGKAAKSMPAFHVEPSISPHAGMVVASGAF